MYLRQIFIALGLLGFIGLGFSSDANAQKSKRKKRAKSAIGITDSLFTQAQIAMSLENYEDAYDLYNRIVTLDSNYAEVYDKLAVLEYSQKDFNLALHYIKKAIIEQPDNFDFHEFEADVLAEQGKNQLAAEKFEFLVSMLEKDEDKVLAYSKAFYYYKQSEDYDKGLEILEKAKPLNEDKDFQKDIIIEKFRIYVEKDDQKSALEEINKLEHLTEDSEEGALEFKQMKAFAYEIVKDTLETVTLFKEILEESHTYPSYHIVALEKLYIHGEEEYTKAFAKKWIVNKSLEDSVRMFPIIAFLDLKNYYVGEDENQAVVSQFIDEMMETMLDKQHVTPVALLFKGVLADREGEDPSSYYEQSFLLDENYLDAYAYYIEHNIDLEEYDKAEKAINKLKKAKEIESSFYYYYSGMLSMDKSEAESAYNNFLLALENLEENTEYTQKLKQLLYMNLGFSSHELDKFEETEKYYTLYLEENMDNVMVLNNLAYLLAQMDKDLDRALEYSYITVKEHGEEPTFIDTYAYILYKKGEYADAKALMEYAIELLEERNEEKHIYYEHLADIERALGNNKRAESLFKKAIELGANEEEIAEKMKDL